MKESVKFVQLIDKVNKVKIFNKLDNFNSGEKQHETSTMMFKKINHHQKVKNNNFRKFINQSSRL